MRVFLLLGSNKGDREKFLKDAIFKIEESIGNAFFKTEVIETKPCGIEDQRDFLNQIIVVDTIYYPTELLEIVKRIEEELGRVLNERWGPREIDIDILFYDDIKYETAYLKIPHIQVKTRDFVKTLLKDCPCSPALF